MKTTAENLNWKDAQAALLDGKFVRQPIWNANRPAACPEFVGETALGVEQATGRLMIYSDSGVPLHEWKPSAPEFASEEWQVAELAAEPSPVVRPA